VHEKHEHLKQESHVLWTHLEARLETFRRAQIPELLVLFLDILAHAIGFLSKRFCYQRTIFWFFFAVLRSKYLNS
jgi:hypothetical protein